MPLARAHALSEPLIVSRLPLHPVHPQAVYNMEAFNSSFSVPARLLADSMQSVSMLRSAHSRPFTFLPVRWWCLTPIANWVHDWCRHFHFNTDEVTFNTTPSELVNQYGPKLAPHTLACAPQPQY